MWRKAKVNVILHQNRVGENEKKSVHCFEWQMLTASTKRLQHTFGASSEIFVTNFRFINIRRLHNIFKNSTSKSNYFVKEHSTFHIRKKSEGGKYYAFFILLLSKFLIQLQKFFAFS